MKNNSEKLLKWLTERPAISVKKLAEEANIPWMSLYDLKRGIPLPEKHWISLLVTIKKYGWK